MSFTWPLGDIALEETRMSRSNTALKKSNLPWGFSIYRCSFKDDTGQERTELLKSHYLVIRDKLEELDGATSHEGRDQFNDWVAGQFALFVDDICLESLVYMDMPVVKILCKQWGHLSPEERDYKINPDWHDGVTEEEEEEEDVGWMYMSVVDYVDMFDKFEWAHTGVWYDTYTRPPQMMGYMMIRKLPGFWRN